MPVHIFTRSLGQAESNAVAGIAGLTKQIREVYNTRRRRGKRQHIAPFAGLYGSRNGKKSEIVCGIMQNAHCMQRTPNL